jgi:hypothetical protein
MPAFRYTDHQILQFVNAKKTIEGDKLVFKDFDKNNGGGKNARVSLISYKIGAVSLELRISAPTIKDPTKYHAVLLADLVRIRGVDFNPLQSRTYGFRTKIPEGWHQNVDYPHHPKDNRHDQLDLGNVADLKDFSRKICRLWNIEFPEQGNQIEML